MHRELACRITAFWMLVDRRDDDECWPWLDVEEVGPSLRYATAKVQKASRGNGSSTPPADDPWASAPAAGAGKFNDEPPF